MQIDKEKRKEDYSYGKWAEGRWIKILETTYPDAKITQSIGKCKEYDIAMTDAEHETKYEVKADRKAPRTKNFVIETKDFKGEPAGIYASEADYIVYLVLGVWWKQERLELIKRVDELEDKELVMGGDKDKNGEKKTEMWKIKCKYLPILFDRVDVCSIESERQSSKRFSKILEELGIESTDQQNSCQNISE